MILHGEEEGSGPALDYVIRNHAGKLLHDVLILWTRLGPERQADDVLRIGGGAGLDVTVYTAKGAMHSGNYGNWLPTQTCDCPSCLRRWSIRRAKWRSKGSVTM